MKSEKYEYLLLAIVIFLFVLAGFGLSSILRAYYQPDLGNQTYGTCTPTEAIATVGNQLATTILAAGSYSWVMIQQPVNATNTLAVSLGETATVRASFALAPASTTAPIQSLTLGSSVDLPYRGAITARTDYGSTTVKVIYCR